MDAFVLSRSLDAVRDASPLVHCITNYVTVNDCANAVLACGASPIMSDEPEDVEDIVSACSALVLNIGTLNECSVQAMRIAGRRARELGRPIVLDPVGAGASRLRTNVAAELVEGLGVSVIRCNMSEAKAIAGVGGAPHGVDALTDDAVDEGGLAAAADFARSLSAKTGAIVAITGAIDIAADAERAFAVMGGSPMMGRITGAGCMLSCVCGAYAGAASASSALLEHVVACVAQFGVAGEIAASRMSPQDGNGSFRAYLLDALFNMDARTVESYARVQEVR